MPYEFLPDIAVADIAFRAWGKTLPEVFIASADAVMNAMIENLDEIKPEQVRRFQLENEKLDLLLFNVLNEFVYYKDSEQLLLRLTKINISKRDDHHAAEAVAMGEKLDTMRHQQRVDVKAITLHQFRLEQTSDGWEATVILDV